MRYGYPKTLLLLASFFSASLSFGEEAFSFTTGLTLFSWENFPADNYSRKSMQGTGDFTYYHYPEKFFLGFFIHSSYGKNIGVTIEENKWERMTTRDYESHDFRISLGPSFRWNITRFFFIPLSLGPVCSFYFEDTVEHLLKDGYLNKSRYYYHAFSGGIHGDAALVLSPSRWFFLKGGLTANWFLFRAESMRMRMNYRTTNNDIPELIQYYAIDPTIYFGIGIRIAPQN